MFFKKQINHNVKSDIENNKILKQLVKDYGAIIAGGASNALMRGTSIKKYQLEHASSDIDLYFRTEKEYSRAVSFAEGHKDCRLEKSPTGLCHNIYFNCHTYVNKIQLVGCVFGSPEEIVSTFDFKNLEVCCYFDSDNYNLLYTENAKNRKDLIIRHSRSPFLMHRIYKYIKYRGFSGVSKESREHITNWIVKASSGYYYENTDRCPAIYVDLLNNKNFISIMKNKDIVSDQDLVYMIGKIKEVIFEEVDIITAQGYHTKDFYPTGKKDLIIEEIKKRSVTNAH